MASNFDESTVGGTDAYGGGVAEQQIGGWVEMLAAIFVATTFQDCLYYIKRRNEFREVGEEPQSRQSHYWNTMWNGCKLP